MNHYILLGNGSIQKHQLKKEDEVVTDLNTGQVWVGGTVGKLKHGVQTNQMDATKSYRISIVFQ